MSDFLSFENPLTAKKRTHHILVIPLAEKAFPAWLKKQNAGVKKSLEQGLFRAKTGQSFILRDKSGDLTSVLTGVGDPCSCYDSAHAAEFIRRNVAADVLKKTSFYFEADTLPRADREALHLGWILSGYQFTAYGKTAPPALALVPAKGVDQERVLAFARSMMLIRNLINMPANDLGPAELESAARKVAKNFKAEIEVIEDLDLLEHKFPLIYAVGEAAADYRRPRLIDIRWGKKKDPLVTIVGKGVCFDTGGLNLKPGPYMKLMKKDMGGAAHALGLAWLVMAMKLPVRLRVLIPAVENSVSGPAFRPGDVLESRKGLYIENTNTDAEGRLILADALTYACEENPGLLIDFATLTGSARAALGQDIPAMFSNSDKLAEKLQKISFDLRDPVWRMPLWQPYRKHIESSVGDLVNSTDTPGDLVYSALFLQQFLSGSPDWIHLDVFAWESAGQPGRPRGGAEMSLRAVFGLIEEQYGR